MQDYEQIQDVEILNDNLFIDGHQFHKHQNNILRCSYYKKWKCTVRVRVVVINEGKGDIKYYYYKDGICSHNHPKDEIIYENMRS